MLKQPAEFPHPGSTAFLAPHGEQVRIIQRNADGTVLVALQRRPSDRSASDTRTVPATDLHAKAEAAIGTRSAKRRRAA